MADGNLSKRKGLLGSLDSDDLEFLKSGVTEKISPVLEKKADRDEVYTKDEASALFANKPYIINAVGDPNATDNRDIIRYPEETENPLEIQTQAREAYKSGRQVILRVSGFGSNVVDFSQMGANSRGVIRFYGAMNGVWYEIVAMGEGFTTYTTPLAIEFIVNATIDRDKNVSVDVEGDQLEKALDEGKQLMLRLSDTSSGASVFGQMTARTTDSVIWHMCLGTEVYEISYKRVLDPETEIYKDVWTAKLVTMATDDELEAVSKTAYEALDYSVNDVTVRYSDISEDGLQVALLHAKKLGVGSDEEELFRLTHKLTANTSDLITSAAVYDAVEEVRAIAKGRATGYVFDTKQAMDEWLGVEENKAVLKLGDNLYIRDVGVPDYWWDEQTQTAQILETQKVDLTEYAKKAESVVEVVATANKASADLHTYYINYKTGDGVYKSTKLFVADNAQPTEDSDNLITSGAVYEALGDCVKKTDYATLDTPGVVKVHPRDNNPYGIHISDGVLRIACAGIDDINAKASYAKPIVPAMLDTAVKACTNQDLTAELTAEQSKLPPSTQAVKDALGDIETALDGIIALQNTLIGGDVV